MSQSLPIPLSAAARPGPLATAARESPDLLFVLRHHRWMIVVGLLLGAAIGMGLFYYMRKYHPGYTATAVFQVRTGSINPISIRGGAGNSVRNLREELRFEANQFSQHDVLAAALGTTAFQRDYRTPNNPNLKSQWLSKHLDDPVGELRKALSIAVHPRSGSFDVSLTTGDPRQSAQMLNAIDSVYLRILKNQARTNLTSQTRMLAGNLKKLQRRIAEKQQELETYRITHNVPGLIEQKAVIADTLVQLNAMLVESEIRALQAEQAYKSIKKQVNNGTLQLSAEMEQFIDNDPGLRDLQQVKLTLEQQLAVDNSTLGKDNRSTRNVRVRIAEVDRQVRKLRDKLRARARLQMQQNAQSIMLRAQSDEQEKRRKRDEQQRRVEDLDRAVAQFDSRQSALRHDQKLQDQLKTKYMLMNMRRSAQTTRVSLADAAHTPPKPAFPSLKKYAIGGPLLGLAAAFGLAYLLELTNTRVRTPRDITRTMQLPLLGWVPDQEDDGVVNGDLMTSVRTSPASMIAESFRQIRGRLAAQTDGRPLASVLVASLSPGGGATTVASNLGNSIALNGLRVLLVDVNFYRPGLHQVYPNIPTSGLSDVVAGHATLDETIVPNIDLPMLHLLGTGTVACVPGELTESKGFRGVLEQLKQRYDLIIFDGAPLSIVSDSMNLAAKVDGVIAVARAGAITRGTVARVREQLRQVNATLLGFVLNAAQTHGSGYFRKNYRSFYEYASNSAITKKAPQKAAH